MLYDQRMQRICNTLQQYGHSVLLVGRNYPKSNAPNFKFATKRLNCIFNKGFLFYAEYNFRLFLLLLTTKAQIYCAIDLDTLLPNTIVARLKNRLLFFDAHEYFTETPEVTNRPIVKFFWQQIANACIPLCNNAYTVGPALAAIFSKQYNTTFGVIRNVPMLTKRFEPTLLVTHQKIILYQGALNQSRGLEEAIFAMHHVNDAVLQIAGEGDLSSYLRNLVIEQNLLHKVKFLGYLQPADLAKVTQQAYIGLNLLKYEGESYYYSLANKFFDYIMHGKPQLCADFPEYLAINKQYHVALPTPCAIQNIADNINSLLSNEILYNQMQQNCIEAAQVFNWHTEQHVLLNLYQI